MQYLKQYTFEGVTSLFCLDPLPLCQTLSSFWQTPTRGQWYTFWKVLTYKGFLPKTALKELITFNVKKTFDIFGCHKKCLCVWGLCKCVCVCVCVCRGGRDVGYKILKWGLFMKGVYEVWNYRNTVDFIANCLCTATLFIELRFFVSLICLWYRIWRNIYSNYHIW